ncbi:MAG: hypothetical protein Q8941_07220, partial [Bacteroidota bacterium]|nr:hypothetical protein [Bacteroidota bacterium]
SFQYTYSYDQNKRVTKLAADYNTDFFIDNIKTILFTYPGSNSAMADITWGNDDIQRDYITYSNANKVITSYDTIPRLSGYHVTHTAYLGTENRIDSISEIAISVSPPEIYTNKQRFIYDAQNNLGTYYDISKNVHPAEDSVIILSRETRGAEINNTFDKILSNMRWYPPMVDNALGIISEPFVYYPYPMLSAKRWSKYINMELTIFNPPLFFSGNFVNTFDSNNLLVHQEIPAGFANKYGGRATYQFTYIKLPK